MLDSCPRISSEYKNGTPVRSDTSAYAAGSVGPM